MTCLEALKLCFLAHFITEFVVILVGKGQTLSFCLG
jgi:hypothetical protein